jgi:predicted nucleic acid-binding protein
LQCRSLDLIIAAVALHHHAVLITGDSDFLTIARFTKLQVHHISPTISET